MTAAMEIDAGTPEPWVSVNFDRAGAAFSVYCGHCRGTTFGYTTLLRKDPGALARFVTQHNACPKREGA